MRRGLMESKSSFSIKIDNYKPLRDIVFESIREAIITGELEPGERLMEIQMAEELGVSRTPVREAIRRLELEGFVVMIPRKGAYVASLSLKDLADVFEIRAALEGLAASLAAQRITDKELDELERVLMQMTECVGSDDLETMIDLDTKFHETLFIASRNRRLSQMMNHLMDQIHNFRCRSLSSAGRAKTALLEHRKIVEAIGEHSAKDAYNMAIRHIESAENSIMDVLNKDDTTNHC